MVDAARQMLDELMGRNRNLHPSEASRKINWDDPDFCQYYVVKFCPHDLFINTRADLGPCTRLHDDDAKGLYEQARPTHRKRQYEDEFLRFCNTMLNDVDRKIQKGKQRLQLMHRDQPMPVNQLRVSKYQEQLNNLNARIKKLLSEAEEAGIRGDVDQAQDLMTLCEQLKDEKETLVAQHENNPNNKDCLPPEQSPITTSEKADEKSQNDKSPRSDDEGGNSNDKKLPNWMHDLGTLPEKQMEVCETCGAFLIVGDAQQRIEDHLMGKQHLGYSKLRKAVTEIQEKRKKEREDEERKRREERTQRMSYNNFDNDRRRDRDRERDRDRDYHGHGRDIRDHNNRGNNHHNMDRHRHHRSSHHSGSHSHSRNSNNNRNHRRNSRERSRSRSHSRY